MSFKLLNVEKFLNSPQSGEKQTRKVSTAKTFTKNKEGEIIPNSGSFYDPAIFGFSSKEIFNQFAYIQLQEPVLHPFIYKNLGKLGGLFNKCLSKKIKCVIKNGMLEESSNESTGGNGINFIINNFDKIKFDRYKNDSNENFVDLLKQKDLVIIKKIPVIPIGYRNYSENHGKIEEDEITDIYKKIININESKDWIKNLSSDELNAFEQTVQNIYKNTSKKEYVQKYIYTLYEYFMDKLRSKSGFFNSAMFGRRIDNVARYVVNAQPDIPSDCAAVPWYGLLITFDVFVTAHLNKPSNEKLSKTLGLYNSDLDEIGKRLEYIYKNAEEYLKTYPQHEKLWIELLVKIFEENPDIRIIMKRDPGWTHLSWWAFKPIILTGIQYQMIVPSIIYAPIGGDSFKTNYLIHEDIHQNNRVLLKTSTAKISVPENKRIQKIYNTESFINDLGFQSDYKLTEEESFEKLMLSSGIKKI